MSEHSIALCHGNQARLLAFPELLPDIAAVAGPRRSFCTPGDGGIYEVSEALCDAVATSRTLLEKAAFDHKIEPDAERKGRQACQGRDRPRCLGGLSPHGV